MAGDNKPAPVTRREFYAALGMLWLFIFFAFGDLARIEGNWTTMLGALVAVAASVGYSVSSMRAGPSGASNNNPGASPSERVK